MKRRGSIVKGQKGWSLGSGGLWGLAVPVVVGMKGILCPIGMGVQLEVEDSLMGDKDMKKQRN